jgi:hypothetical protein
MTATLRRLAILAALSLGLIAAGPKRVDVEIFVYDVEDGAYDIAHLEVTAQPGGQVFTAWTSGPNSHARFTLPGGTTSMDVIVTEEDHNRVSCFNDLEIGGRSHVGGHGFFLLLPSPCQ